MEKWLDILIIIDIILASIGIGIFISNFIYALTINNSGGENKNGQ